MDKYCRGCDRNLPAEDNFTKDATKPDGFHSRCRECKRKSDMESAKKQREKRKLQREAEMLVEQAESEQQQKKNKAKDRAVQRLIDNHEGEYVRLLYSEYVLAGIMTPADRPIRSMQWVA